MFVEEIKKNQKGKKYKTVLVRESYRIGKSINHRTIANITNLPEGCIEQIKSYLKGNLGGIDVSKIYIGESKEYGASKSLLAFARKLKLDSLISYNKIQWREDVLALIVGQLVYPGNEETLIHLFSHTILWEACGHEKEPDFHKNCYKPMMRLHDKKNFIQKKLADKHLKKETALFFLMNILFEKFTHDPLSNDEEEIFQREQRQIAIMTSFEGCPIATILFPKDKNINEIKKIIEILANEHEVSCPILISNQTISSLNFTHTSLSKTGLIFPLTEIEMRNFFQRKINLEKFSSKEMLQEFDHLDSEPGRYVLAFNANKEMNIKKIREEMIQKTHDHLNKIQHSDKVQEETEICSSVEQILNSYKTGNFFKWKMKNGRLEFYLDQTHIKQQEQLDGFYLLYTDIEKKRMNAKEIVDAYQELAKMKKSFTDFSICSFNFFHLNRPLEELIEAKIFTQMLSYYLRWHAYKRIDSYFPETKKEENQNFFDAIQKLKLIRIHSIKIGDISLDQIKNALNDDQRKIISALGVTHHIKLAKSHFK